MKKIITFNTEIAKRAIYGRSREVAALLNYNPSHLSAKLNGKVKIDLDFINNLAQAIDIDATELIRVETPIRT